MKWWLLIQFDELSLLKVSEYLRKEWLKPTGQARHLSNFRFSPTQLVFCLWWPVTACS